MTHVFILKNLLKSVPVSKTIENMGRSYETIDLAVRLYCLELISNFHWDEPEYYPLQLIFAGVFWLLIFANSCLDEDELLSSEERNLAIQSMLADPLSEIDFSHVFNFNSTKNIDEDVCRLIRPVQFYESSAISQARTRMREFRDLGYCPLHRHPDLVEFIEALWRLYGGQLAQCVRLVNLEKANVAANSPPIGSDKYPQTTVLEYHFREKILENEKSLMQGMWRYRDEESKTVYLQTECKG